MLKTTYGRINAFAFDVRGLAYVLHCPINRQAETRDFIGSSLRVKCMLRVFWVRSVFTCFLYSKEGRKCVVARPADKPNRKVGLQNKYLKLKMNGAASRRALVFMNCRKIKKIKMFRSYKRT